MNIRVDPGCRPGTIGTSLAHREWAGWSLNQEVSIELFDPFTSDQQYLGSVDIEVAFVRESSARSQTYESDQLAQYFTKVSRGLECFVNIRALKTRYLHLDRDLSLTIKLPIFALLSRQLLVLTWEWRRVPK